ncbi:Uncharacterized protein Fot_06224 [Forsythia ovata]|uniref:Uncharacterized protein n=1 Tax=Forsythia ovata TaxID=205694 RepID=A0ABD1WWG6_9LAMI
MATASTPFAIKHYPNTTMPLLLNPVKHRKNPIHPIPPSMTRKIDAREKENLCSKGVWDSDFLSQRDQSEQSKIEPVMDFEAIVAKVRDGGVSSSFCIWCREWWGG